MKRVLVLFLSLFLMTTALANAAVSDFEDLDLYADSYWNGSDGSGGFTSGGTNFHNNYDADWGSWDGFSCSNMIDNTTIGLDGQYNNITGGGAGESSNYAVGYYSVWAASPPTVTLPSEQILSGAYFTNNNYAYYSMLNGDAFAKKFEDGDWFKLTITGKDASEDETGTVDFYLADGTNIVKTWKWLDLSSLGEVKSLEFVLSSSDTGEWGMNTPAYFCMDNLNAEPPTVGEIGFEDLMLGSESKWNGFNETGGFISGNGRFNNNYNTDWDSWDGFSYSNITDTTTDGTDSQYNAITGMGVISTNYAVGYYSAWAASPPTVTLPSEQILSGAYFTNNNYAYYSMLNGDAFAKKFEDGDWFKLTITGKDASEDETGTVDFYLADGTNIVKTWTWLDLSSLGEVKSLEFVLSSSDTADWGMNTPAYFCMDGLNGTSSDYDANLNGIPDSQEVDVTVDLDNDGTPDVNQPTIKCVNTVAGNGQIGVSCKDCQNVSEIIAIKSIDPATISDNANRPATMPLGLLSFTLRVNNPGDVVTVTVYLSEAASDSAKWYKHDDTIGWRQCPEDMASFSADGMSVVLTLTDGSHGDADGIENGIIVDPSGLAGPLSSSPPSNDGDGSSGGGGGCFIDTAASGSVGNACGISLTVLVLGILASGCSATRLFRRE